MSLRRRLQRLQKAATSDAIILKLRDGGTKAFSNLHCAAELFLTQVALGCGECRDSDVLEAVRAATPESRREFEESFGPIEMEERVVSVEEDGGIIREYKLLEYGTVEATLIEVGPGGEEVRTDRPVEPVPDLSE